MPLVRGQSFPFRALRISPSPDRATSARLQKAPAACLHRRLRASRVAAVVSLSSCYTSRARRSLALLGRSRSLAGLPSLVCRALLLCWSLRVLLDVRAPARSVHVVASLPSRRYRVVARSLARSLLGRSCSHGLPSCVRLCRSCCRHQRQANQYLLPGRAIRHSLSGPQQ